MIDAHCHLNYPGYENDFNEVVKRAEKKGVEKIVNVGTDLKTSRKAVELAKNNANFYAVVGIHPHDANSVEDGWEKEIEKLLNEEKVIGIGEIGLDYFAHNDVDSKIQKKIFEKQLQIAIKKRMPLQIHSRRAASDIIDILSSYRRELPDIPGMFHCMSGNLDYLKKVLNLGFYVGFDGNITYKGIAPGEDTPLRDLVEYSPLERLITETDAPWLTPVPHRGSRNEPSYVIITAEFIAGIKGVSFDKINSVTTENAGKIFNI